MNIREACHTLAVSPAGYYAHQHKDQRQRRRQDAELSSKVSVAFDASRRTYGSPRIMHTLRHEGAHHGKNRIARLMRQQGLQVQQKRRFVPRTTIADKDSPVSPNHLLKRPAVTRLNEVWLTDITYLPTAEGFLYLAAELDLYSRRIIGWSTHTSLATELTTQAFERALHARPAAALPDLLHHSDRGCQYTSATFRKRLDLCQITQSMSRKGNCYDNAAMERSGPRSKPNASAPPSQPPALKPTSWSSTTSRPSTTPCASTAHCASNPPQTSKKSSNQTNPVFGVFIFEERSYPPAAHK